MDKFNKTPKPIPNNSSSSIPNVVLKTAKEMTSPRKLRRSQAIFFQYGVGIMLAAFALLTFLVVTIPAFSIDLDITLALQDIDKAWFSHLMHFVSFAGFYPQVVIIPLVIIALLYSLGYRWEAVASLIAAPGVSLLNILIKSLVQRERPSVDLVQVTHMLASYSFPSGHVMFYTGFFGFICFLSFTLLKPSWIKLLLLVIFGGHVALVGLSRVYMGEHWASDALGAYLLGGVCLMGFTMLYRWGKPRYFVRQPVAAASEQD